jgi:hypothetical protein
MVKAVAEESAGMNPHIKEGSYVARLAGVFEKVLEVKKVDERGNVISIEDVNRWEWTFGVRSKSPEGDLRMTVLTSPKITTKSKAFGFVKALYGKAPELGVEVDTDNLIGNYAQVTIKDKARKDATGNLQVTSEITDMLPVDGDPEEPIEIDGLVEEPDNGEPEVPSASAVEKPVTPPAQPPAAVQKKKTKK